MFLKGKFYNKLPSPIVSYPAGSSSLLVDSTQASTMPKRRRLNIDFRNKANNNALGQTPTSLRERAESISGFTKGHHFEIPTTPM